jgi:hypothetical protein
MALFGNILSQGQRSPVVNPDYQTDFSLSPAGVPVQTSNNSLNRAEPQPARADLKSANKGIPDRFDFITERIAEYTIEPLERVSGLDLPGGKTCDTSATITRTDNISDQNLTLSVSGQTISTSDSSAQPHMTQFAVQMFLEREGVESDIWGKTFKAVEHGNYAEGTHTQTVSLNDGRPRPIEYEIDVFGVCNFTDGTEIWDQNPRLFRNDD